MGDLHEKWRIQEFSRTKKHSIELNSSWNAAFKGILACAVLLNLPILLPSSVLGIALLAPFGFVFVVYSAVNKLLNVFLDEKRLPFQFRSEYETLYSDESGNYDVAESMIEASEEFKTDENVGNLEQDYDVVESRIEASEEYKEVNKYSTETDENMGSPIRMTSPFLSWEGSGEFGDLEQLLAPPSEKQTTDESQQDYDVKEGKFKQIEPQELVRETREMFEAVRNEGKTEIESIQESTSVKGTAHDLERLKLLFVEEDKIDRVSRLQTINEQLENGKQKKHDALGSLELETESTTMEVSPNVEKMNTVRDVWNATYKNM